MFEGPDLQTYSLRKIISSVVFTVARPPPSCSYDTKLKPKDVGAAITVILVSLVPLWVRKTKHNKIIMQQAPTLCNISPAKLFLSFRCLPQLYWWNISFLPVFIPSIS